MNYENPIQNSFEATTQNYEKNVLICLNEINQQERGKFKLVIASHNEDTVRFAVKKYEFSFSLSKKNI
jgi:proline dehydrogenase